MDSIKVISEETYIDMIEMLSELINNYIKISKEETEKETEKK